MTVSLIVIFVAALVVASSSVKVIPKESSGVLFRLGRFVGVRRSGIRIIAPLIERLQIVNTGPQSFEGKTPDLPCDEGKYSVTFSGSFKVSDPAKAINNVADYKEAITKLVETGFRKNLEGLSALDLSAVKRSCGEEVRSKLKSQLPEFGLELLSLEVKDLNVTNDPMSKFKRSEGGKLA